MSFKNNTNKLVKLAVIAALGLSANAMAKGDIQPKGEVLKLGASETVLSQNLATNYKVTNLSLGNSKKAESDKQISANVAKAKMLHINILDFYGDEPRLNKYIDEAMKQDKLLVLENTDRASDVFLDALPFTADAEVMLLKPSFFENGSKIELFGNVDTKIEKSAPVEFMGGRDIKPQQIVTPYAFKEPVVETKAPRMSEMQGAELYLALENVNLKINQLEAKNKLITGGSLGYQCPSDARAERLCWAAVITNAPYQHISGDANINILNHYSVAQYRTDQLTAVAVSPNGAANPNMQVDTTSKRAFFLESHKVQIDVTSHDQLYAKNRYPQNSNRDNSFNSTSGMTFGVTATAQEKPSMGANIAYSESQSVIENYKDWEYATTSPDGHDAHFDIHLYKYRSINDWVRHPVFQTAKFHDVPSISKYGLQYTTEGVWTGTKDRSGYFNVSIYAQTVNAQLYFTSNNIFAWNATKEWYTHSRSVGGYSFNNGWLKSL